MSRELDIEVGLKVMGYAVTYKDACHRAINDEPGSTGMMRETFEIAWAYPRGWVQQAYQPPRYSSSISDAWLVWERIRSLSAPPPGYAGGEPIPNAQPWLDFVWHLGHIGDKVMGHERMGVTWVLWCLTPERICHAALYARALEIIDAAANADDTEEAAGREEG